MLPLLLFFFFGGEVFLGICLITFGLNYITSCLLCAQTRLSRHVVYSWLETCRALMKALRYVSHLGARKVNLRRAAAASNLFGRFVSCWQETKACLLARAHSSGYQSDILSGRLRCFLSFCVLHSDWSGLLRVNASFVVRGCLSLPLLWLTWEIRTHIGGLEFKERKS